MKLITVIFLMLGMNLAHADGGRLSTPNNAKWKEECGSCHVAYPPQLLTAKDWQRLMGSLDRHFGSNATLDARDHKEILGFLKRNAGSGEESTSATLRISDTPWFRHEHRGVSAGEWTHPQVGSRSNCSACHGKIVLGS